MPVAMSSCSRRLWKHSATLPWKLPPRDYRSWSKPAVLAIWSIMVSMASLAWGMMKMLGSKAHSNWFPMPTCVPPSPRLRANIRCNMRSEQWSNEWYEITQLSQKSSTRSSVAAMKTVTLLSPRKIPLGVVPIPVLSDSPLSSTFLFVCSNSSGSSLQYVPSASHVEPLPPADLSTLWIPSTTPWLVLANTVKSKRTAMQKKCSTNNSTEMMLSKKDSWPHRQTLLLWPVPQRPLSSTPRKREKTIGNARMRLPSALLRPFSCNGVARVVAEEA
mmetsp:Transcript_23471/g.39813  ORF Transcript_23471/g.39813 Transcript_23471/m.39813 type:complete len:274 (+) Transcript_23471:100-921(+)